MSPWYIPRLHPGNFDMSITNDGLDSGKNTLPRTNVAPENRPSQKETSIPTIHFQVRTVSFQGGCMHSYGNSFSNVRPPAVRFQVM